jgi:hypothetical protein
MSNPIRDLQIGLVQDLVKLEESNITQDDLKAIEATYEHVYSLLNNLDKE